MRLRLTQLADDGEVAGVVLQVRRPEAVQGHQDEGRPGETGRGRREEGKELSGFFFVFFSYFIVCSEYYKQMEEGGGLEKLFITSSNPFRT